MPGARRPDSGRDQIMYVSLIPLCTPTASHTIDINAVATPRYRRKHISEEQVGKDENDEHKAGADLDGDSLRRSRLHNGSGLGGDTALGRRGATALPKANDVGALSLVELRAEAVVLGEKGLDLLLVRDADVQRLLKGNVRGGRGVGLGYVLGRKAVQVRRVVTLRLGLGTKPGSTRASKSSQARRAASGGASETSGSGTGAANTRGGGREVLVAVQLGSSGGRR